MENLMEKNIGGYKVAVQYDMNPDSPREWDNLGTDAFAGVLAANFH